MADLDFNDFEDFWPFYLGEHADRTCRVLHLIGTTGAVVCVGLLLVTRDPSYVLAALLSGYSWAWVGHFGFEGNRPATFKHPLWSMRADIRMWWRTLVTRELKLPLARPQ